MAKRKLLLLIDGSHALFRAFHAIRHLLGPDGRPTNAVFGWTSMLLKLIDEHQPDYIAACFDGSGRSFRVEIDPEYKANRSPTPPELIEQWPIALRVTQELGVKMLEDDRLEADDIIATLCEQGHAAGMNVLISTGDKDLMALVRDPEQPDGAWVRQLEEKKGQSVIYDAAAVVERWGVRPDQIADLLAIMGDSVDNVPGVRGIGKKGAVKLLADWDSFEGVYANIDSVQTARTQQLLRDAEEVAKRSRVLVELVRDGEVGAKLVDLNRDPPQREALTESFRALGFKRLLRQYFADAEQVTITTQVIQSVANLEKLGHSLAGCMTLGVDVITTERDEERHTPMRGELVGLAVATAEITAYIPISRPASGQNGDLFAPPSMTAGVGLADVLRVLGPLLSDAKIGKVGHDLKYTSIALRRVGISLQGLAFDTLLATYLLNAGRSTPTLANLGIEHLNCRMVGYEATFGAGRNKLEPGAVDVAALGRFLGERAAVPVRIQAQMGRLLDESGLLALHDALELPLTTILADVEHRGVRVDIPELKRQSIDLGTRCDTLQASIQQHAGGPFNVGSPKQLGEVLFDKLGLASGKRTKTGWSTNQATLEKLRGEHPIIDDIFGWRQLSKLKSTYTDALVALVHPDTGRVHTSFNQAVAATGRLSSSDPNLQNIPIRTPEGRIVRRAFVATPGNVLLSADYSQIELRVMAHMADEPTMQEAFAAGIDIHKQTAARIFHIELADVTAEQRSAAKTINFGVLYGMGSTRLAASIGVSRDEAKAFIERYFERFGRIKDWVDATLEHARAHKEVRTMFGRRRLIADIDSSNHGVRAAAERIAVNTPVQGSAADIIKRAMLRVHDRLAAVDSGARLLLQVHDELLLSVPQAEADATIELVVAEMGAAAELKVPLKVDARCAVSWADAH